MYLISISFGQYTSYAIPTDIRWKEPVNINILNSEKDDFAPVWNRFTNKLYFNSTKTGYSNFYLSEANSNNIFTTPKLVEGEINQKRSNQSYITFESRNLAYLSTFRQFPERSYLNIFQTRKKKNEWIKAFDVDSLINPIFMAHPTVSPDASILIFSSMLNSEFGDTDLWMALKQENNTWGTLIRISQLQTPGNEITPFLASNDTLYFASDGQEGPGAYDLFISVRKKGVWQRPFPLSDINTEFDESDFCLLPDGRAIFASNRPGGKGGLDIYITEPKGKIKEDDFASNIEFSIAAQVPAIKIKEEISEVIYPIIPYIFLYDELNIDKILPEKIVKEGLVKPDIISVYKNSLSVIAQRVKNYIRALLYITAYLNKENNVENFKKNLKEALETKLGLSAEKIIINTALYSEHELSNYQGKGYLIFNSNDERVFHPLQISDKIINIMPPALDLKVDARPRRLIKNWQCNMFLNEKNEGVIANSVSLPHKFLCDLEKHQDLLLNADSLVIDIIAEDTLNLSYGHRQLFNIIHSSIREEKTVQINNKRYKEFFIICVNYEHLRDGNTYKNIFGIIAENTMENVIISYYGNSVQTTKTANEIKLLIKEQINGKRFKVQAELRKEKYNINDIPDKFIFRVLVEK